jgi:hypothetical protein
MLLDSSGNLGIGTASPGQKLDVNGVIRSRDGAIIISIGTATKGTFLPYSSLIGSGTDYTPTVFSDTGLGITFAVNGSITKAMTLDSSGNLLVGVATANANGGVLQLKSGITFPATAVAATDANTLDDYEEGTWTVQLQDGSSNNATMEAGFTTANYVKIGRQVSVTGIIYTSSVAGLSGIIRVAGLPFAVGTGNQFRSAGAISGEQLLNITSGQKLSVSIYSGLSTKFDIYISNSATGGSNMTPAEWSNDGLAQFSLTYFTD